MRKLCLLLCAVLCFPLCAYAEACPDHGSLTLHDKIERLRTLFENQHLTLPPQLTSDIPCQQAFYLLQDFAKSEHQWVVQPAAPVADPIGLAKESYPSGTERVLRSTTIKAETIQQPKTIQLFSTEKKKSVAQRNPDTLLWKISATMDSSRFVPTTSDVQAQAKTLTDVGVDLSVPGDHALCSSYVASKRLDDHSNDAVILKENNQFEQCVLRSGTKYMFARFASGLKGTANWAESPSVRGGVKVQKKAASQSDEFSGEVDFDPTKLAMSGSDWYSGYQSAVLYGNAQETMFVNYMAKQCGTGVTRANMVSEQCARRLAGPHGFNAFLAVAVPTVSFIEKTNFDFAANNGELIQNRFPSKRLADLKFSIDMTRLIPSPKARQDALEALAAASHKKPAASRDSFKSSVDRLVQQWATQPEDMGKDDVLYTRLIGAIEALP
jgi:hypothetical protein